MQQKVGAALDIANSYKLVAAPEHPRANSQGRIAEHVVVAEDALGHYLPDDAEVHHHNRLKWDNRNRNLVICQDRRYHRLLHVRTAALKACGHADWRKCKFCKTYASVEELIIYQRADGTEANTYHQLCNTLYRREWRAQNEPTRKAA